MNESVSSTGLKKKQHLTDWKNFNSCSLWTETKVLGKKNKQTNTIYCLYRDEYILIITWHFICYWQVKNLLPFRSSANSIHFLGTAPADCPGLTVSNKLFSGWSSSAAAAEWQYNHYPGHFPYESTVAAAFLNVRSPRQSLSPSPLSAPVMCSENDQS